MKLQSLLLVATLGVIATGTDTRVSTRDTVAAGAIATIARDPTYHAIPAPIRVRTNVLCYAESGVLYDLKEEIFSKVEGVYRDYGIDIQTAYNDGEFSRYDIVIATVEPESMSRNGCGKNAGCAHIEERFAMVSTLRDDVAAQNLTREERIGQYTNVIVHEIAHLFSVKDIPPSNGTYTRPANDNVMHQEHFRSFSSSLRRLRFSPRQKEQMHTHLRSIGLDTRTPQR